MISYERTRITTVTDIKHMTGLPEVLVGGASFDLGCKWFSPRDGGHGPIRTDVPNKPHANLQFRTIPEMKTPKLLVISTGLMLRNRRGVRHRYPAQRATCGTTRVVHRSLTP